MVYYSAIADFHVTFLNDIVVVLIALGDSLKAHNYGSSMIEGGSHTIQQTAKQSPLRLGGKALYGGRMGRSQGRSTSRNQISGRRTQMVT